MLLIINSSVNQDEKVSRVIDAIERSCGFDRLAVLAPSELAPSLLRRGLYASNLLLPRVRGQDVEYWSFAESPRAIRWIMSRKPDLVLGSEPYAPNNEETKPEFEQRVSSLLGLAQYVAHSLPDDRVFPLKVEDLWHRSNRVAAIENHRHRVSSALTDLHRMWASGSPSPEAAQRIASSIGKAAPAPSHEIVAMHAAAGAYRKIAAALSVPDREDIAPIRFLVDPVRRAPSVSWMPSDVAPVETEFAANVRWRGPAVIIRGQAEGPYSYLLVSEVTELRAGDAVLAEGRVYHGGITIGLINGGVWVARVDLDEPGAFVASVVATKAGPHTLVMANCLRGTDLRTAAVLRRFGWVRQEPRS